LIFSHMLFHHFLHLQSWLQRHAYRFVNSPYIVMIPLEQLINLEM
jgi:hypothetical protein